jgi:hypothetical protein
MDLKRLLKSSEGKILVSIVLGLGLASLFRKAIKIQDSFEFNGPVLDEVEGKVFKQGDKCYKYESKNDKCKETTKILDITMKEEE